MLQEALVPFGSTVRWEQDQYSSKFTSFRPVIPLRQRGQALYHLNFSIDIYLLFPLPSSHLLRLLDIRWEMTFQAVMGEYGWVALIWVRSRWSKL